MYLRGGLLLSEVAFHIGLLPDRPVGEIADLVAHAERLGFDGAWIADSQSIFRDCYAALTLAADRTQRITLATGVTNPVTRHPAVLASALATLQEQSEGRLICGIGVGESAVQTIGRPPARIAGLERATQVLRDLLAGRTTSWEDAEIRLTWMSTPVPIWFASTGPRSLRLGGAVADGVLFQVGAAPELVSYAMQAIASGAEEAGRAAGDVGRLVRLACSVAPDRDWARREVRGYVAAAAGTVYGSVPHDSVPDDLLGDLTRMKEQYDYYEHASATARHEELITERIVDAISISGTPDEAVPRFRELVDLGVDGFVLPITTSDPKATMETLAHEVIPRVRS
jgi:5,10-methylenetetrahydromethanopterin reductase